METIAHDTPRSLELLIEDARAWSPCPHCSAEDGRRCSGPGGVHFQRFIQALILGLITVEELAVVVGDLDEFGPGTIIRAVPNPDSPVRVSYRLGFEAGRRLRRWDGQR
jgi:hypothetical protein